MSILPLITMGPFRQRILKSVALIHEVYNVVQYTKFILAFKYLAKFSASTIHAQRKCLFL